MKNNINYEQKYHKYKNKYQNLINQKAGMGYHRKYWNEHVNFKIQNEKNLKRLILNNEFDNKKLTQFNEYSVLLKKQLIFENNLINLDFINNFFRYIYYDIDNIFSIKINDTKSCEWNKTDTNNKYEIYETFNSKHGNTTVLFLNEKNNNKNNKVLKIFNNIDVNINNIKDYLSL